MLLPMKILMTDSKNERLLAHYYASHLRSMKDITIGSLYYTDEFDNYYKSIWNKATYRIFPKRILDKINSGIIRSIENFKPDLVWIIKGMEIYPETLDYAKKKGIKLVNYNPDHPFIYKSAGSGNEYVKNSIPVYDLHLSYSREILKDLQQSYQITGKWLPFGYEISQETFESATREREIKRVAFTGMADEERKRVIDVLTGAGIQVDLIGPDWQKFFKPSSLINVFDGVYSNSFWNVLRKYRVQINMFRKQNINSHNMRSFEIPGVGGIMLAPYSAEHVEFFEPGKDAFFYKNDEELIERANNILALSDQESGQIRLNARTRSEQSGYSYLVRSEMALEYFKSMFN
jgi:spore maturation protein CgeB